MCADKSLNAKFVLQALPKRQPTAQELIESARSEKPSLTATTKPAVPEVKK